MTERLSGLYFLRGQARSVPGFAAMSGNRIVVWDENDAPLAEAEMGTVRISSRLANIPRRFRFADGSCFETRDNDAADAFLSGHQNKDGWLHRLERSWRVVLASVVLIGVAGWAAFVFGIPAAAKWAALHTPPDVAEFAGEQTLYTLNSTVLYKTKLTEAEQKRVTRLFAATAKFAQRGPTGYHLVMRNAPALGANAMALPDGTIVMTDALLPLVKNDAELEGVFAHEMAHVDRAHSLQSVYQAAIVPMAIAVVMGDASQIAHVTSVLPGIVVQAAYSRGMEQEADDDAAVTLKKMGSSPVYLAAILERMERKACKGKDCPKDWLGSHPETSARVKRLREEAR